MPPSSEPQLPPGRLYNAAYGLSPKRARVIAWRSPGELVVVVCQQIYAAEICADPDIVVPVGNDAVDGVVVELGRVHQILRYLCYGAC